MIICLDQQHVNQPRKPHDKGAILLRPGFEPLSEAFLVSLYVAYAREYLELGGHVVFTGFFGAYSKRHTLVNKLNPDLYLACHFNSGGGEYSLAKVQPHARNETLAMAACLADAVRSHLALRKAAVRRFTVKEYTNDRGRYSRYERGYISLKGIKRPMAVLYEPAFLRDPMLRLKTAPEGELALLTRKIGLSIADGVREWCGSKKPKGHVEGFD